MCAVGIEYKVEMTSKRRVRCGGRERILSVGRGTNHAIDCGARLASQKRMLIPTIQNRKNSFRDYVLSALRLCWSL